MCNSTEHEHLIAHKTNMLKNKNLAFELTDVVFILLINIMPIVGKMQLFILCILNNLIVFTKCMVHCTYQLEYRVNFPN